MPAITAAVGFNHYFWECKDYIGSDIAFLFFAFLALNAIRACERRDWSPRWALAAGIAIYLSYATRVVGVVLVPCVAIYCPVKSRRLPAGAVLAGTVACAAIGAHLWLSRCVASYVAAARISLRLLLDNLMGYAWGARNSLWPLGGYFTTWAFFLLLVALAVAGFIRRAILGPGLFEIFSVLYGGTILLWGAEEDLRFLIPLVPLWFYYSVQALRSLPDWCGFHLGRPSLGVLAFLIFASYAGAHAATDFGPMPESFGNRDFMQACAFLRDRTAPGDVVVARKPRLVSLITGRRATVYHVAADAALWDQAPSRIPQRRVHRL